MTYWRRALRGLAAAACLVSFISAASADDIDGIYDAHGQAPGGKAYSGDVKIVTFGETGGIAWKLGAAGSYAGLSTRSGDVLGAAYSSRKDYFGIVVYEVRQGSLTGVWTDVATPRQSGRENLEGPAGLDGAYKIILGENADGSGNYSGQVLIKPNGKTYMLLWLDPKSSKPIAFGVGVRVKDRLVVGFGRKSIPGVVGYQIDGGTLNGVWSTGGVIKAQDSSNFSISVSKDTGTETLTRKP